MHACRHRLGPDQRQPGPSPLSPAPRAPAMPRPHPCLAPPPAPIAPHHLSTAPLPPAPIGLASSASRPSRAVARIASTPLRAAIRIPLCRHRADSALIAPPITTIVRRRRLTRVALRRPHRAHRVPTSASPPPSLSLRCGGPRALAGKNRTVCIPFSPNARKRPPFLATSARNACFSRSRWQHPRPMHPFPGAIGRFRIHGARILPPRALFRVEEPEITHGAKMLPAPPGLSAAAACGPAERALRPAARAWPACRMRAPCHLACARRGLRPPAISPAFIAAVLYASRFAVRDPPRGPRTDASRHLRAAPIPPAARTHRVQETSGTAQTTQCGHKNRIPKWRPY